MKRALELFRDNAVLVIGLALLCGMLRPPFFGSLVPKYMPSAHELRLLYDFSLILFGGIFLCASTSSSAEKLSARARSAGTWSGAVSVIGIVIVNASRFLAPESTVLPASGVVATAAGLVLLSMGWMRQLSFSKRDDVLPMLMLAFLLNHATGLLDALSREAEAWAIVALPVFSSICLARCAKHTPPTQPAPSSPLPRLDQMRILALLIACAEVFCTSFLRASYTGGGIGYEPSAGTAATYVVSAVVAVIGYALVSGKRSTAENALAASGVSLGLLVMCALFTAGPLHNPVHHLVTGLHSMLIALLFGLVSLWQHDGDKNCLACTGAFAVLFGSAIDLTFSIAPGILGLEVGAVTYEQRLLTTLAATLLICLGCGVGLYCVIKLQRRELNEARKALAAQAAAFAAGSKAKPTACIESQETRRAAKDLGMASQQENASRTTPAIQSPAAAAKPPCPAPPRPHPEANGAAETTTAAKSGASSVAWLAERYSLTPRESETAALIAKGYSVKRIAEELGVTPGTVQSHSKSIYRKLDIHRKDELITLTERHRPE